MTFVNKDHILEVFENKRVAIFGSAPSCLKNDGKDIDAYDIIVRVNNYKVKGLEDKVGSRTDVHYSFYGGSIKKTAEELEKDGVWLCMCKCPNELVVSHHKMVSWDPKNIGGDFRPLYRRRKDFWFCDTYIPTKEDFMPHYKLMNNHMPTTGFSCILTIMGLNPKEIYITGFDGFKSGIHNVDEKWNDKSGRVDPICHLPGVEIKMIKSFTENFTHIKVEE
jgi:hypothetical protein